MDATCISAQIAKSAPTTRSILTNLAAGLALSWTVLLLPRDGIISIVLLYVSSFGTFAIGQAAAYVQLRVKLPKLAAAFGQLGIEADPAAVRKLLAHHRPTFRSVLPSISLAAFFVGLSLLCAADCTSITGITFEVAVSACIAYVFVGFALPEVRLMIDLGGMIATLDVQTGAANRLPAFYRILERAISVLGIRLFTWPGLRL